MKNISCLLLLLLLGCAQNYVQEEKLWLSYEVIPEGNNYYTINWKDTLGVSEGYHENDLRFIKRPREVWCVVTSITNDTLGYYRGLSTAQTFANFQTSDSVVKLNFMTGLNLFPDNYIEDKQEMRKYPIKYKPIIFNINRNKNHRTEVELQRKY